jgi:hypothetical protein
MPLQCRTVRRSGKQDDCQIFADDSPIQAIVGARPDRGTAGPEHRKRCGLENCTNRIGPIDV